MYLAVSVNYFLNVNLPKSNVSALIILFSSTLTYLYKSLKKKIIFN